MRKLPFAFTLSLLLFSGILLSQITSGVVTMSITEINMQGIEDQEEKEGVSNMLKDMNMVIYFRPGEQVTEMNMMGMVDMKMYFKDGQMIQYMDMMGQKIKVISPIENADMLNKIGAVEEKFKGNYSVSYDKTSSTNILGFQCYKATVKLDLEAMTNGEEIPKQIQKMDMEWYVTEEIKIDNFNIQQMPGLKLKGMPLRLTLDMGSMTMTYEATNIEPKVDDSAFAEPQGDYKEMTAEELEQMGINIGGNH
jgi:hypothetical protein